MDCYDKYQSRDKCTILYDGFECNELKWNCHKSANKWI